MGILPSHLANPKITAKLAASSYPARGATTKIHSNSKTSFLFKRNPKSGQTTRIFRLSLTSAQSYLQLCWDPDTLHFFPFLPLLSVILTEWEAGDANETSSGETAE